MKISVNDEELYRLSEVQKKVIKDNIDEDIFEEDMKRRLNWVLTHKYEMCLQELKNKWMQKIKERYSTIPTNDDDLATLITNQADYKSKKQRKIDEDASRSQI
jgi:hypothetical protein